MAKKSAALARLHEISSRLWLTRDLRQAFDEILAGAIELLGADTYRGTTYVGTSATYDPAGVNEFFNLASPQALPGGIVNIGNDQALSGVAVGDVDYGFEQLFEAFGAAKDRRRTGPSASLRAHHRTHCSVSPHPSAFLCGSGRIRLASAA